MPEVLPPDGVYKSEIHAGPSLAAETANNSAKVELTPFRLDAHGLEEFLQTADGFAMTLDLLVAQVPISNLTNFLSKRLEKQLEDAHLENNRLRLAAKASHLMTSKQSLTAGKSGELQNASELVQNGSANVDEEGMGPDDLAIRVDTMSKISTDQIDLLMKRLNPECTPYEVQDVFTKLNIDKDGYTSFDGFLGVLEPSPSTKSKVKLPDGDQLESIQAAFLKFDKDGSNKIDLNELQMLCEETGRLITPAQAADGMKQMDKNGDKTCDFDEFMEWWMSKPNLGGTLDPKSVRDCVLEVGSLVSAADEEDDGIGHKLSSHSTVLSDPNLLKQNVRKACLKPYEESQHYHPTGICQRIAGHPKFELVSSGVIGFNAIWIAFDTDMTDGASLQDKHFVFQFAEFCFFWFFIFEWAVRFGAFRRKTACLSDSWFLFDTALIIMMIVDTVLPIALGSGGSGKTSMLRLVRLVKLTRMARVARLLRRWPELTILIKGISIAARSVVSTLVLMVVIVYIFALAFRQLTNDTKVGERYFKSVIFGMKELLMQSALPDNQDMVNQLGDESIFLSLLAVSFFVVSGMTLMNMLIGVLCEVIGVVSAVEKESMKVSFVKGEIVSALKDTNMQITENLIISKEEFQRMLMNPIAAKALRTVGVDPVGLVDFCDFIFSGHCHEVSKSQIKAGLTFNQFIELILELGGTNAARVKDVIDLRKVMLHRFDSMDEQMARLYSFVQELILSLSRERQFANSMLLQCEI